MQTLPNVDDIVAELTTGRGYYVLDKAFGIDDIDYCYKYIKRASDTVNNDILERRVWGLHDKKVFSDIANHEFILNVYNKILGSKHRLAAFNANRMMPGAQAQEPHTDFPYWSLYDPSTLPINLNSSFSLACQTLIPLQDFTENNGATEVVPYSQTLCRYPDLEEFNAKKIKLLLQKGDLLLYNSLLWHCAGYNNSKKDRTCLLGQYVAYFVKDMS